MIYYVAYFFGGVFLANAVPHVVAGMRGEAFQTPFAKPRGVGLSSSLVNVLWGWFNLIVGYVLILHVGAFDVREFTHVGAVAFGGILISLYLARHFGQFHGGLRPGATSPRADKT